MAIDGALYRSGTLRDRRGFVASHEPTTVTLTVSRCVLIAVCSWQLPALLIAAVSTDAGCEPVCCIVRRHRMHEMHEMQTFVIDVRAVCRSVCVSHGSTRLHWVNRSRTCLG